MESENQGPRTSLVVQWLRLCASIANGVGLIPGQGTGILHATWCGQKIKKKNQINNSVTSLILILSSAK